MSLAQIDGLEAIPDTPFIELFDARTAPLEFLRRTSRRYGDLYRYTLDGWPAVVINDPALARQALQGDGETLGKEGTPDMMMLRPMLGRGLMTNEGEAWRLSRTAAQPAFAAGPVEGYAPGMLGRIDAMLDRWAGAGEGAVLDLEQEFSRMTLEVVGDCLLGADLDGAYAGFGRTVEVMNRCVAHFDPADREAPVRFAAAHGQLHAMIQGIIDHPQRRGELLTALQARCAADPTDPARILRDEVVTFVMAGHETTAKALTWAMHLLASHPEIEAAVRREARAAFADGPDAPLSALTYTWQVLQETMRLYPPVWLVSRRATAPLILNGAVAPAGTLLVISPYLLHRHPDHWSEPERFDPERFAPSRVPREAGAYMPFGAGRRVCIGRLFAAAETTLALARLVARFECRHAGSPDVQPEALVTLRPRDGLRMTVRAAA